MSTLLRRQREKNNTDLWYSFNNVGILGCTVFLISAVNVNFSILKYMDLRTKQLVSKCLFYQPLKTDSTSFPPLKTCYGQAKCEGNPIDVEQVSANLVTQWHVTDQWRSFGLFVTSYSLTQCHYKTLDIKHTLV